MFLNILKYLFNIFCGSPEPKPTQQGQQSHEHTPAPHYPHPQTSHSRPQKYSDPNQTNQSNEYYVGLRARANNEGDQMAKAFEQSHQAYARGDKAEAKTLSNRGKEHQRNMDNFNKEASEWIFTENNKDSRPGEIDLHGLYVKEAIAYTDRAIVQAKQRGESELHLIVGKGLHSKGGAAKIKPAVEELMQKHRLFAELDPHNAGVLVVQINSGTGRGVQPDEITRRIERSDEGCIIM